MFTRDRKSAVILFVLASVFMSSIFGSIPTGSVLAATVTVTNTNDSGVGSLRQAIIDAHSGDTITFHPSLAGKTITLVSELSVGKALTINGSGLSPQIKLSGGQRTRIIHIASSIQVTVSNLIFLNGLAVDGGAIYNSGSLILDHGTFSNHSAYGGSGIYNAGTLVVKGSLFSENSSSGHGGAIANINSLTITNSVFTNNRVVISNISYGGGAISNSGGTVAISNSNFTDNSADTGGGIYNTTGTLTIRSSLFSNNLASGLGGGIFSDDHSSLTVINSTFSGNRSDQGGGFINHGGNAIATNNTFAYNEAVYGGGIMNNGSLIFSNNILANNPSGLDCYNNTTTILASHNLIESEMNCGGSISSGDPLLGPLANNGGSTQTFALKAGSPAINAADDTNCPETDQRGVRRPQGSGCDIGAYESPAVTPFKSGGGQDGWVLETSESSNQGGVINATTATFNVGDTANRRQYRAILSFNTSSLPDNAVITRVILKIKKQSLTGTNPFTTHGKIAVDIRKGAFSNSGVLQVTDFQAPASEPAVGLIANNPQAGGRYVSTLKAVAYPYINPTGVTQLRLRFQTDDDNDAVADFIRFYSGNATAANRPVLVITYYVP